MKYLYALPSNNVGNALPYPRRSLHIIGLDIEIANSWEHVPLSRRIVCRSVSGVVDNAKFLVSRLQVRDRYPAETWLGDEAHSCDIECCRLGRHGLDKPP